MSGTLFKNFFLSFDVTNEGWFYTSIMKDLCSKKHANLIHVDVCQWKAQSKEYLHTDAYAGYNKVVDVTGCLCWSHVQRDFVDALPKNIEDAAVTEISLEPLYHGAKRFKHLPLK